MLRVSDFAKADEPMAIAAYRFLRDKVLTEAMTDTALDFLKDTIKIKWLPFSGWLISKVIDPLVPEKILELIEALILRAGWATERDFETMNSPFTG